MADSATPAKPIPPHLQKIARFVRLMDSEFKVPGTSIRFGIDPLIGLIPGLGDLIDYAISAALIVSMMRSGASSKPIVKMIVNITLDGIIGLVPFVGRLFDVFYKANQKNLQLAIEYYDEGKHQGSARNLIIGIAGFLFLIFALLAIGAWFVVKWLWLFLQTF